MIYPEFIAPPAAYTNGTTSTQYKGGKKEEILMLAKRITDLQLVLHLEERPAWPLPIALLQSCPSCATCNMLACRGDRRRDNLHEVSADHADNDHEGPARH